MGALSGNGSLSGSANTGLGSGIFSALTSGTNSSAIGNNALHSMTSGEYNTAIGYYACYSMTQGNYNVGLGSVSLYYITTGSQNIAIGHGAAAGYTTGTESNNIVIGYDLNGTASESNVIRIGNSSATLCYLGGITGATPTSGNTPQVVLCDSGGNLAPISSSTADYVLTSNGSATPTFQAPVGSTSSTVTFSSVSVSTSVVNFTSITVGAGTWVLSGLVNLTSPSAAIGVTCQFATTTASGTPFATNAQSNTQTSAMNTTNCIMAPYIATPSGSTTYYFTGSLSADTSTAHGYMTAVRIA